MSSLMKWFDIIWSNPCQDYQRCKGAIADAIGVNEPSPCITIIIIVTIKINNFLLILRGVRVVDGAIGVNEPATWGEKIWGKGKSSRIDFLMQNSHATSKCKTTLYKRKIVASLDFSTAQLTCKRGWISWIAGVGTVHAELDFSNVHLSRANRLFGNGWTGTLADVLFFYWN